MITSMRTNFPVPAHDRDAASDGPATRPATSPNPVGLGDTNVVFFGGSVSAECQRCGAYCSTDFGHKYCNHVTCPIALREFKRRRRKRTSSLEKVYLPQILEARRRAASTEPALEPVTG